MTTARQRAKSDVYQLKVILEDITPLIWRSIQVPGDITLYRLHRTLQAVMGWTESHLYMFDIGGAEYSDPSPEWDIPVKNAQRTRLADIVPGKGSAFIYEYDLGDGWTHELIVEDILPRDPDMRYPVCLAGERACPPEDCGGAGGL